MANRRGVEDALDQALEAALTNKDFSAIRTALRKLGYQIAKDESEPNLFKATQTDTHGDPNEATLSLLLEQEIRTREVESLRLTLSMSGHNINKPDFNRLAVEQRKHREGGHPTYFQPSTLGL